VSGIVIDANDTLYAADSESEPRRHPGWLKGIRIGSLKDGKVTGFFPPHPTNAPEGAMGRDCARRRGQHLLRRKRRCGACSVHQEIERS